MTSEDLQALITWLTYQVQHSCPQNGLSSCLHLVLGVSQLMTAECTVCPQLSSPAVYLHKHSYLASDLGSR